MVVGESRLHRYAPPKPPHKPPPTAGQRKATAQGQKGPIQGDKTAQSEINLLARSTRSATLAAPLASQ